MGHQSSPMERAAGLADSAEEESIPLLSRAALQWNNQGHLYCTSSVQVDLELELQEMDNEVVGDILFSSNLFHLDTIKRHIGYLIAILRIMVNDSTRPVSAIGLLSPPEKRRPTLETWNETSFPTTYQALSYDKLNSRANRLAHHLIGLGVRPDTPVAICVDRSPGMIVGIIAIMKAGGAYVLLDPSHARDSSHTIVDPNMLLDHPTLNLFVPELTSRYLADIIYISGSAGKPKGVMIEHRGVVNLAQTRTKFVVSNNKIVSFSSLR
ncbi:MAG: hypothetical protein J3Q66DRAFT_382967 [Benniella sp.]|nr:MAG: hypothetical protein J3Q66DRAFT_382967 [Benniella sp.]